MIGIFSYDIFWHIPGVKVGFTRATGIPTLAAPRRVTGNSGTLGEMIAITSPFLYPARVKALPHFRMRWPSISYVYLRPVTPHSCESNAKSNPVK